MDQKKKGKRRMLGKLKKNGRRIIALILSLLAVLSMVSSSASTVFAADGTLYFNSGENIPYGTYSTTRMTFDGSNTAYCLEPYKKTPSAGSYQYNFLPESSPIRKALYYLNGGYGYEKVTKSQCFGGWSDTDSYIIGHLALSYIFDNYNDSGDAFYGAPANFITKAKEVISVINGLPNPPQGFQAFILPADSHQTIAGSWYKAPYGWIELQKSSANSAVSTGNGNYSLAGAKYGIYQGNTQVAERKRLGQSEEKTATRNMFYDEHGKHVRTKKEILDGDGNVRKGCKIIKKGEVYERKIFTIKDGRFKQEPFLDEAKVFYTNLINQMVIDDKDRLSIFDRNGPYLATKKVGKNNPKAEEIKADNEIRMEWNRAVDRAIVSGVSETEAVELKKTEITDMVKKSVEQNGSKPEVFGDIVRAAVALLESLIKKVMQKVMDIAEKVIDKAVDAIKEVPKETDSRLHAGDNSAVQTERKKIPFPVNPHRKTDVQDKAGQPQQKDTATVKKSVIEQMKPEQKSVPVETKQLETERPPQPKSSVLANKYPRLKEIDSRLKEQNRAIFEREKKRDKLKTELSECTGIFKGGRRRELQQEIDSIDIQISNMKKRLSSIVKGYKFDSVQAFYKELNVAKSEYLDYRTACTDWEKTYGDKVANTMSIRDRIRQNEQIVKQREIDRDYRARQKDKGAR